MLAEASKRPYIVDVTSGAALKLDPPKLPDLTRYTAETAIAKIRKSPRGHAEVRSMLDELSFKGFMGRDERMRDWAARQRSLPQVIFVSGRRKSGGLGKGVSVRVGRGSRRRIKKQK